MYLPNRILALDMETSGFSLAHDHPMSIALVEMIDGELTGNQFASPIQVSEKCKISLESLKVQGLNVRADHELMAAEIKRLFPPNAPTAKEAMASIAAWVDQSGLQGVPVVAHKLSFDLNFYDQRLALITSAYSGSPLGPIWICTQQLGRAFFGKKIDQSKLGPSLDTCVHLLNLPTRATGAHESYEDAILCGRVYFEIKNRMDSTK